MIANRNDMEAAAGRSDAENDGFARVVLAGGFCTRAQIHRCLHIQSNTNEGLSLGQSLLREGFLTQDQYSQVLVLLRQGYKKERGTSAARQAEQHFAEGRVSARQGQEDRVLGGIVVAEGWISAGQLKICMDESAKSRRPLAETLAALGYLEPARVDAILGRLERSELCCPSCRASLSVVRLPTANPMRCPRCRSVLGPVKP